MSWDDDGGAPRAVGRARAALESALCLAQCLDVKNSNPADGLTANQMAPRVAGPEEGDFTSSAELLVCLRTRRLSLARDPEERRSLVQIQAERSGNGPLTNALPAL